jgi:uncharacterized membrane protein YhiD involved in acid resistance
MNSVIADASVRLTVAAAIGAVVVLVQRRSNNGPALSRPMEQAHVLLCLAGALMMLIVGDSLPRAFGIAGAAAIIRFRTPIEDPRDITVLFLLMALGMAAGLGLLTIAGVGTVFVCMCLLLFRTARPVSGPRSMKVALVAEGRTFPAAHVAQVFGRYCIAVETLEFSHGARTSARYRASIDRDILLDEVSAQLLDGGGAGLASVTWEAAKRTSH